MLGEVREGASQEIEKVAGEERSARQHQNGALARCGVRHPRGTTLERLRTAALHSPGIAGPPRGAACGPGGAPVTARSDRELGFSFDRALALIAGFLGVGAGLALW